MSWLYNYLPIRDPRIWETNLDSKDLVEQLTKYPISTSSYILRTWSEVNYKSVVYSLKDVLNSPINGNSLVRIGNKPIFTQNLLKASIEKFIDIYDVVRNKFYTYQDLRENYQLENVSFLQYCLLIAAVPRYMKVIINQDKLDAELDLETNLDT